MKNFFYYLEFAKNAPSRTEIVEIENFFREKKLHFVFTINSVNKKFGRVAAGLKYETGGGYDYNDDDEATFIFCIYRGPSLEKLKEEIVLNFKKDNNTLENIKNLDDENLDFKKNIKSLYSKRNTKALEKKDLKRNIKYLKNNRVLIKDLERKALFDWLKEKKYIFCLPYRVTINQTEDDTFNLGFDNRNDDNHQLSLYELDVLLTKIFKIYLVDDAFGVSNNFKTEFIGTDVARNILYKKFLTKYLADFPGKPYRFYQNAHKEWDDEDNLIKTEKSKNFLRAKSAKEKVKISEAGFIIEPKKLYLRKILKNEKVKDFVDTIVKLEKLTDVNCRKIYIDFLNDKINEKDMKNLFNKKLEDGILHIEEIIESTLKAKEYKKEIEAILNKQRKKIPFNKFISKYINIFNSNSSSKNQISSKILKPSKRENLIKENETVIHDITTVTNFIKNNNIKLKKMGEVTLEKIKARIEEVKNIALEMKAKLEQEIIKMKKESEEERNIEEKKKNDAVEAQKKELDKIEELRIERDKRDGKVRRKRNPEYDDDPDLKPPPEDDEYAERVKEIEEEIKRLQRIFLRFTGDQFQKNSPLRNTMLNKIKECNKVIDACDNTLYGFFSETTMKKYGYKSLNNMITDFYRSNLFNSKQIKSFLFEMNIIKNNFFLYLFFN